MGGATVTRPEAYEQEYYPWTYRRLPKGHPGKKCAVFVVHGIGQQNRTETAANLRAGFEDALEKVDKWQQKNNLKTLTNVDLARFPAPFTLDGYWSNYNEIEKTFPDDWKKFNIREKEFFSNLWRHKTVSVFRTYFWFLKTHFRILSPTVMGKGGVSVFAYLLYWAAVPFSFLAVTFSLLRHPVVLTDFLSDVRLYGEPRGMIEKAIVQRIDYRVGKEFLSMIGLDWDFKKLKAKERLDSSGLKPEFTRIIWVAHSLGTVISYNVISDLCTRALDLKKTGTKEQKDGVNRFFKRLYRFVTMGSPLDKFAFLFEGSLRPWPEKAKDFIGNPGKAKRSANLFAGFWVNFYSVFDPVSGVLTNRETYNGFAPRNFHIRSWRGGIPGWSHSGYWRDQFTLSYILTRTFGKKTLLYKSFKPWPTWLKRAIVIAGFLGWFGLVGGTLYLLAGYWREIFQFLWDLI